MKEKKCPICGQKIRSDAKDSLFCALCGMGISHNDLIHTYKNNQGKVLHFCCETCAMFFKKNIDKSISKNTY